MGDQYNYYPGGYTGGIPPNHHQAEALKSFWQAQLVEVSEVPPDPTVFKNHQLPLARIKKIMKSDEDVRMISAEAPVLFAKACEMFILELTLRSWMHAEENKRRTLQRNDVAAAITKTDIFDFLIDIVPREDGKPEEGGAAAPGGAAPATAPSPAGPGGSGNQQAASAASTAAPAAAAPRPPAPPGMPTAPGMFFPPPFPMPPGALGDPSHAAAAAAAAAVMMRPPMGVDPNLVLQYQQQILAGQAPGWPHLPAAAAAAAAGAAAAEGQAEAAKQE